MKKLILLSILTLFAFSAFSQKKVDHKRNSREVLEFKMKYLAQEMDLSEDQQKKFFPIYEQLDAEVREVFRSVKAAEKRVDKANSSEEDYAALNKARTDAKLKLAEIERKYDEKFSQFLTKKQIVKMKDAEESFRKKMRESHRKKHR